MQSWLPVIHHDVPTTFLAKVEEVYSTLLLQKLSAPN